MTLAGEASKIRCAQTKRIDAPLVNNLVLLVLDDIAHLRSSTEYESRDFTGDTRFVLCRVHFVPFRQSHLPLPTDQQQKLNLQAA